MLRDTRWHLNDERVERLWRREELAARRISVSKGMQQWIDCRFRFDHVAMALVTSANTRNDATTKRAYEASTSMTMKRATPFIGR